MICSRRPRRPERTIILRKLIVLRKLTVLQTSPEYEIAVSLSNTDRTGQDRPGRVHPTQAAKNCGEQIVGSKFWLASSVTLSARSQVTAVSEGEGTPVSGSVLPSEYLVHSMGASILRRGGAESAGREFRARVEHLGMVHLG